MSVYTSFVLFCAWQCMAVVDFEQMFLWILHIPLCFLQPVLPQLLHCIVDCLLIVLAMVLT